MANEVRILVRTQNDTKAGFDGALKETDTFAENAATTFRERFAQRMRELGARIAEPIAAAGQDIGNRLGDSSAGSMGRRLSERIRNLHRDVEESARLTGDRIGETVGRAAGDRISRDVDSRMREGNGGRGGEGGRGGDGGDFEKSGNFLTRLVQRAAGAGSDAAKRFGDGFVQGMSAVSQTIVGQALTIILVPLALGIAGPLTIAVAAAITSGILLAFGGGIIALGIAGAFKDPRIQGAATELKDKLGKLFEEFGKPFRGPVANFMEDFSGFLDKITPDLKRISEVFAPILDKLGEGVIKAMEEAWPGIAEAIEASAPFVETLADRLPEIGEAIGKFFSKIAGQGDDAQQFFNDLITVIITLIDWVGTLISEFTSWYSQMRNVLENLKALFLAFWGWLVGVFGNILDAAAAAFSWIPGLGPKLAGARAAFSRTKDHINAELSKIRDKDVKIRMRVFGLAAANAAADVARTLSAMGYAHGGVRGAQDGATSSGLTWVGEAGPELVSLPAGSRVHTAGDSARMSSGGTEEVLVRLIADRTTERGLFDLLWSMLQAEVMTRGGGNVQLALGRG
jgi:hypothetical protein